jgi:aminocarboxymuconate-semialdehyde decarboxylase
LIIDAHCHVIVPEMTAGMVPDHWRPAVRRDNGRYRLGFRGREINSVTGEFTDVATMLAEAAATGIGHLLLSPWINLVPVDAGPREARLICQVQNDALAAAAAAHPGRVSAVGAVPLQDPALAGRLIADLVTAGGLCGAEIPTSVGARYLGDDFFQPFWEAAEASGALVFIHPSTRGLGVPALDGYYLWNSVGNPLETAVTAAHIAVSGVLERHPGLRVLLAHGGGALPAVRGRLRRAYAVRGEARARSDAGPDESLRRFYYDTVTHDRDLLADLVRYAGADHLLLGSDRPFDMGTGHAVDEVRALGLGTGEDLVLSGNAARLLGMAGGPPQPGPAGP